MRTIVSLISLSALLAAQTPFTPCPAAVADDGAAPAAPPPTAPSSRHHHHHDQAAAPERDSDAGVTLPRQARHAGSCTMLTRCDWVAVPTAPADAEPLRGLDCASLTVVAHARPTAELIPATPPPKSVS